MGVQAQAMQEGCWPHDESAWVCFVRHGQALHNVSKHHEGTPDNPLTEQGIKQCEQARRDWAGVTFRGAELIVVSPLRRALQTAVQLNGGQENDDRMVVSPLCRERWSGRCDEGTCKSELLQQIPWLANHQGVQELPEVWFAQQPEDELARVREFLTFLRSRQERRIIVVAHGAFLKHIVGQYLDNVDHRMLQLDTLQDPTLHRSRRSEGEKKRKREEKCQDP